MQVTCRVDSKFLRFVRDILYVTYIFRSSLRIGSDEAVKHYCCK